LIDPANIFNFIEDRGDSKMNEMPSHNTSNADHFTANLNNNANDSRSENKSENFQSFKRTNKQLSYVSSNQTQMLNKKILQHSQ
jgi:hypothetical protein